MLRHLLIDGYNLIHKIPSLRAKASTLEFARNALVCLIQEYQPQGSPPNDVTVIFDGNDTVCQHHLHGQIKVVFSRGQTADDLIKKMIEDSLTPQEIVVVSDDQELWQHAKAFGASYWSVSFLMTTLKKKALKMGKVSAIKEEKQMSFFQRQQIDEELKQRWLK